MKDCRVLVIEDELLIGLDLVSTLEDAGFHVVEHASTEREALDLIAHKPWHAVVADANLNGRSIDYVATVLRDKSIPFLIVTGYNRDHLPSSIGEAVVLGKPVANSVLVQEVQQLCLGYPPNRSVNPQDHGSSPE